MIKRSPVGITPAGSMVVSELLAAQIMGGAEMEALSEASGPTQLSSTLLCEIGIPVWSIDDSGMSNSVV